MAAPPTTQPQALASATAAASLLTRGMTICDGQGGALTLDLTRGELRWLAYAFRSLIAGAVPPGATMLKVDVGSTVYLVNYYARPKAESAMHITDLYDPAQQVVLPRDLAEIIAALLEQILRVDRPLNSRRVDG